MRLKFASASAFAFKTQACDAVSSGQAMLQCSCLWILVWMPAQGSLLHRTETRGKTRPRLVTVSSRLLVSLANLRVVGSWRQPKRCIMIVLLHGRGHGHAPSWPAAYKYSSSPLYCIPVSPRYCFF